MISDNPCKSDNPDNTPSFDFNPEDYEIDPVRHVEIRDTQLWAAVAGFFGFYLFIGLNVHFAPMSISSAAGFVVAICLTIREYMKSRADRAALAALK